MSIAKDSQGQGRNFQIAELYQAAFRLDISDGACRVLLALISRIDTNPASKKFQTTWVGRDWISLQIRKSKRQIHDLIEELIALGVVDVAHTGRNKTNITRVNIELLLSLGWSHYEQVESELASARKARKDLELDQNLAKLNKTDRRISATPNVQDSSDPEVLKTSENLISASNQKDLISTVASPPASQSSQATSRAGSSRAHGSTTKPQGPKGFDEASIASWESLEVKILHKLEQLRIDGLTTSERINEIHRSLLCKRYTIGSDLYAAYEQGINEAHEAQIAFEWIHKVALSPASDPLRYVTTLRAFIRGKADMFTASAESRIMKQRRANAS